MNGRALSVSLAFALTGVAAQAAQVDDLKVVHEDRRYTVVSEVSIAAPIDAVFDVLADYDRFERISSIFQDSKYLERDENGDGTVYTQLHQCVAFFCKTIERTETVTLDPPLTIKAIAIPERSDLHYGESLWTLSEVEGGTNVRYEMAMEPNFWVPPLIGPYLIKRMLRGGSQRAAERVERYANEAVAQAAENEP